MISVAGQSRTLCRRIDGHSGDKAMVTVKSIPEGVQAVFPMLVCQSPEAEMNFCATAFGAVEQVRRPGPDGSPIHIAMRINDAFLVVQSEFPDVVASRAPSPDGSSPVVIFVYVADVDLSVERAVAIGAKVLMPAQNQFWGDRTARIIDPSGHVWTVASRIEETTEERRANRWSDVREGRQDA
jgi:PhnB protein